MTVKIVFKSSIAKILIIMLFLKFMFIFVIIPNIEMGYHLKSQYKKNPMMYSIGLKTVSPPPFLSLLHTHSFSQ
jgi:hypothetical protein